MKAAAMMSVFAAANAAEAPLTNLALTWKDCGGLAKIDSVAPSTVPLGTSTKITGSGTSPVKVTGGTFSATVKAGWIPLASCSGPLGPVKKCDLPLGAGSLTLDAVPLPIGPGKAAVSLTVALAANLPAQLASTTTHATAVNEGNQKMVCIDVYLKQGMSDEVATVSATSGGIIDDILKLVCKLMKNGSSEAEAETLICKKLKYEAEVAACDKVIDVLWKGFENKECPASRALVPGGILDDLKKLICRAMKNGMVEKEAESLICDKLKYKVEVAACDKIVDMLWKKLDGKCPAGEVVV